MGNFFYYSKEGVTENKIDPTEAERKITHIVNKVQQPKQMEQIIILHNINTQENSWCDVPGCTAKITYIFIRWHIKHGMNVLGIFDVKIVN